MSKKKPTLAPRKHHVSRCTFITPANRRCKMTTMPGQSRSGGRNLYCSFHAKQEMQVYDAKVVSREILGPLDDFRSACAINRTLGKLFTVTVEDRIPIRNAAVLAAIAQLMLRTLHPLRNELIDAGGAHGLDVILRDVFALLNNELDSDRPARSPKVDPRLAHRKRVEEGLAILRSAGQDRGDDKGGGEVQDEDQEEGDENNEEEVQAEA